MILKLNKKIILGLVLLSAAYLFTRLQNLTAIPVFGDEAIYLRWSQIIKNVETLRFIPLTDGKQPLFMWLTVPFFKVFPDPLLAGRFLSVLCGLGVLLLLFLVSCFFKKPSLLPSILYLLLPFTFFFDRLALSDNLLSFFGIFSFFITILLSRTPRFDLSMILGVILGLAWITKSPAIYFILLSLLTYFFLNSSNIKKFYYPLVSLFITFVIYNLLRLGPQFHMIAIRNRDYVWPLSEILKHPLDPLRPHFFDLIRIISVYIGGIFTSLIFLFRKNPPQNKIKIVLLAWAFLPIITNLVFAKVLTARYLLFSLPYLILLLSLSLNQLGPKWRYLFLLLLIPQLVFIFRLSTNPFNVKLLASESGYLQDWTSGWGIRETAQYLKDRAKVANVIVGTEGKFGTLPDGLQIYTNGTPQLTIIGVGLQFETLPENLVDARQYGDEVYLLINRSRLVLDASELTKLDLVKTYSKPAADALLLFRFK